MTTSKLKWQTRLGDAVLIGFIYLTTWWIMDHVWIHGHTDYLAVFIAASGGSWATR